VQKARACIFRIEKWSRSAKKGLELIFNYVPKGFLVVRTNGCEQLNWRNAAEMDVSATMQFFGGSLGRALNQGDQMSFLKTRPKCGNTQLLR
jgi:hypothetical protein